MNQLLIKIKSYSNKLAYMYSQQYPLKVWLYYFYKQMGSVIFNPVKKKQLQRKYDSMLRRLGMEYLESFKVSSSDEVYYSFKGALIPYEVNGRKAMNYRNYLSTFYFHCSLGSDYSQQNVEKYDRLIPEGPYFLVNKEINVTIKPGDIVIDAGSWIGDFSALASNKGGVVYAFEPVSSTFKWLEETAKLNNKKYDHNNIRPVKRGLSNHDGEFDILSEDVSGSNSFVLNQHRVDSNKERINITSIDNFVESNGLEKIDFIKADIEGAERLMLEGAQKTLKNFGPKLAICTYHLPDDPIVLEKLIKSANPKYIVVHGREKLYAAIPNE